MIFRGLLFSLGLPALVFLVSTVGVALSAEPGLGTKNFNPPASVPNYFSGEAGAIRGVTPAPLPGTTYAVPAVRPRSQIAMAAPRHVLSNALVRGRDGRYRFIARGRVVHGHHATRGGRGFRAAHVAVRRGASHASARHGRRR